MKERLSKSPFRTKHELYTGKYCIHRDLDTNDEANGSSPEMLKTVTIHFSIRRTS